MISIASSLHYSPEAKSQGIRHEQDEGNTVRKEAKEALWNVYSWLPFPPPSALDGY